MPDEPETTGDHEQRPSRVHIWMNTASTVITAFIAIPALILAVITYRDQQADSESSTRKEASQIAWYWQMRDKQPTHLVLENRSLRPVYRAFINIEDDSEDNRQVFYIDDTVAPCSRVTYPLGAHGKDVLTQFNAELYFIDSLNHLWRMDYTGALKDRGEGRNARMTTDLNMVETWKLKREYEELSACG
ncbi:hypothetical protein [Streptomyces umbrinus]|uniref:hypothetical protein n=1 Tax=Streptomyces umbrinus TaxID=67370 RepID=UPI003C2B9131